LQELRGEALPLTNEQKRRLLEMCPVPQIRNNFSGRISQSFWPSFVKYTAAGVRYPRLMCSLS
jgi:hypothetical protein